MSRSPRYELPVETYNSTLIHPTISAVIHHLARRGVSFNSSKLIERLAGIEGFPAISVGDLIASAQEAGVKLRGAHAELTELDTIPTPFLTFLKLGTAANSRLELVQVQHIRRRRVVVWGDRFGDAFIRRENLNERWSGILLMVDVANCHSEANELQNYRSQVQLIPNFVTPDECRELIEYCEAASFRRSRVLQRRSEVVSDVVEMRVRSSTSTVLKDRAHPILSRLYAHCAYLERVRTRDIETIQCVRYKRGQKFRAHFDGGVDLPRLTTYLLYLNDDFSGGETYFPMLDSAVAPIAGGCLRFPSCDREGRVFWQSEHGGLPVRDGVKYALNIWVRCPTPGDQSSLESRALQPATG